MKTTKNIQAYIPVQFESTIKGYWKDKQGKVYIDNILVQHCTGLQFERIKANLFNSGELAIFYIQEDTAYIQSKDTLQRLTSCHIIENVQASDMPSLLNQYLGFTYFENTKEVHIWTN